MRRTFISIVALAPLLSCGVARAQEGASGRIHLSPNGDIRALARRGQTLWIGTSGGLVLYDLGGDAVRDRIRVGPLLPDNSVRALRVLRERVFVATDGGLAVFDADGAEAEVYTPRQPRRLRGVPLTRLRSVDFGPDEQWYLGTFGAGVGVVDGDRRFGYTREDSLLDNNVFRVVRESDETVYFATAMGLCAIRDSVWVGFQAGAGIPRGQVRDMIPAGAGRYYLLVAGQGVFRFDGRRARRVSDPEYLGGEIAAIALDKYDQLWAVGRFGGIAVYRGGHWARVGENDPLVAAAHWRCATADGEGGVFFGSSDGLVVAVVDNVLRRFRIPVEIAPGPIGPITADAEGALYFIGGARLWRVADSRLSPEPEPAPAPLTTIDVSPDGGAWVAGRWGVFRRDDGDYTEFSYDLLERDAAFSAMSFDERGYLWMGTRRGGLYRFDGQLWMRIAAPAELFAGSVRHIVGDGGGSVWSFWNDGCARVRALGTAERFARAQFGGEIVIDVTVAAPESLLAVTPRGLWKHAGGDSVWTRVQTPSGTDPVAGMPALRALAIAPDGTVLVGTERGIGVVRGDAVRFIEPRDGLGGTEIQDLFVEGDRFLWVGFRRDGVARLPLAGL